MQVSYILRYQKFRNLQKKMTFYKEIIIFNHCTFIKTLLICLTAAFAVTHHGSGAQEIHSVDWSELLIRSTAESSMELAKDGRIIDPFSGRTISVTSARTGTREQAREAALARLIERMKKIRIDPFTDINSLLAENETARQRMHRILSSKVRYTDSPSDFFGTVSHAELRINYLIEAFPFIYPEDEIPIPGDNEIPTEYTSLIIDARGLNVEPMIFPSIYNESGREIYGRDFICIKTAARRGAVSYTTDEESALNHGRAGKKPYFSVAVQSLNRSPVISLRDHRKITSSPETIKNIKECRVIILIDRDKLIK